MGRMFLRKMHQTRSGQGMVEFALALPIFLLLLLGVIEFGRLLVIAGSVYTAAREGARYGSAAGYVSPDNLIFYYRDCAGMSDAAERVGFIAGLVNSDITIRYAPLEYNNPVIVMNDLRNYQCGGTYRVKLGDRIVVQVSKQFRFLFLGLPAFPITSLSARTIVTDVPVDVTQGPTFTPRVPPTRTPTITPIPPDTATPTETATSTPTPLDWTPPTPTETATFTETPTPTETFTPTPTVADVCTLIVISNVSSNLETYFDISFYNLSVSHQFWLSSLNAWWGPVTSELTPASPPTLLDLYISGAHETEVAYPHDSPLEQTWLLEAPYRALLDRSTLPLNFTFNQDAHIVHLSVELIDTKDYSKRCIKSYP